MQTSTSVNFYKQSTKNLPKKAKDILVKENDYRETSIMIIQKIGQAKYSLSM